jgi:hypothetical protein
MAERASSKQYLVVDDHGIGHLPVRDSPQGPLNHHLMGAAWAALHGGYRGKKYEGPGKEAAIAKLKALYRSEGMELPDAQRGNTPIANHKSQIANCDCPRFVVMLAEPPATGLIRIPIAITGQWKGAEEEFSIGLDDLTEIRKNFLKKPTREINVDYEHASEVPFGTGGPVLSAGRIVKLEEPEEFKNGSGQVGKGQIGSGQVGRWAGSKPSAHLPISPPAHLPTSPSAHLTISPPANLPTSPSAHLTTSPPARFILWGWYEPTERARQLIAHHEYRYISPAIRWGAKDKVTGKTTGTVLTSVALVNKPFLEEMPEIHLCELGGTRAFVSLGQLHVPGPLNQISVASQQPEQNAGLSASRDEDDSGEDLESLSQKEKEMAKTLKLKCLTDEHLEQHGLGPEHKGRIGVFDGEELIGVADAPEGWAPEGGGGDEHGQDSKKLAELFATELGLPGKSFLDIAALVKRGVEAPQDQFAALSESIHEGKINLVEAGKLADAGRVRLSTILQAQEAERKVEAAVKAGKVLPRNRAHALRLALSDATAFAALIEQGRPAVDLRSRGHAGGGEQPTAQQALMAEVNAYAKENKCSVGVALSEVTKRNPDLWQQYSEEVVTAVESAVQEEE